MRWPRSKTRTRSDCPGGTGGQVIRGQNGEARNRKRQNPAGAHRGHGRSGHHERARKRVCPGHREVAGQDGR